jgi:hypothetical protein
MNDVWNSMTMSEQDVLKVISKEFDKCIDELRLLTDASSDEAAYISYLEIYRTALMASASTPEV